jgi:RNA polymerase sigma factor (sigma-70 family)
MDTETTKYREWRFLVAARGDEFRASDFAQEVWAAVWVSLDQLQADADTPACRHWMRQTTRSVLSHLHQHAELPTEPLDASLDIADDTTARNQREQLEEMMAVLKRDDRQLIQLLLDGFKPHEAAQVLDISLTAFYQRYHRAIKLMREAHDKENTST